mgnify:CR=1 FL=1|jgi:hypothetical protein
MKGVLVRVAIDSTCGHWNSPYEPLTGRFVYVPIPESPNGLHPELIHKYDEVTPSLKRIGMSLPYHLLDKPMHLDPDFEMLTYGDVWPRSKPLLTLVRGDFIVFYAGLRSLDNKNDQLVYALIGFYRISEVVNAVDIPKARWHENAHTRRVADDSDIVVRATREGSGRLTKAIPIGEFRNKAYRVRQDILNEWGGLSVKDGYLQRSAKLPEFTDPAKFLRWWNGLGIHLINKNNEA